MANNHSTDILFATNKSANAENSPFKIVQQTQILPPRVTSWSGRRCSVFGPPLGSK